MDRATLTESIETKTYNGVAVPEHLREGLLAYVLEGRPTGGFLYAVLTNDLFEAVGRADEKSLAGLFAIIGWLYNEAPADCYGDVDKVKAWMIKMDAKRFAKDLQLAIVKGIGPPPAVDMVGLAHSFFVAPYKKAEAPK